MRWALIQRLSSESRPAIIGPMCGGAPVFVDFDHEVPVIGAAVEQISEALARVPGVSSVGLTSAMYAADPFRATLAPHNEQKVRRYDASLIHEHRFDEVVSLRTLA